MRITGGSWRGRVLKAPSTQNVRPTSDRLRESIFNILVHAYGDVVAGARVIDLFAGTGAMGLEALSRDADFALFVDNGAEARGLLRANIDALGAGGVTKVFRRDAMHLGAMPPQGQFTLAFLDPPYGKGLAERALAALRDGGWLASGALLIVEESADTALEIPEDFEVLEQREYGDTQIMVLRVNAQA
ncbi:MAG: 16S rRNA (guanine(966)-N(2))-methyltransferase RsmD [Alphaproteobacteria bacterium]|nr:16S rRNA (guanine(966)-N(2))-methyltransferase RsmD [Alphaproteobacteria bacterium]